MATVSIDEMQQRWRYLYQEYLPTLAKARDPVQKKWPVVLDHCFARIVLDNAIGIDKPWTEAGIKPPAIKNMSATQMETAIALAEKVATGEADLVSLDERSLQLRGKQSKVNKKRKADGIELSKADATNKKMTKASPAVSSYFLSSPRSSRVNTSQQKGEDTNDGSETMDHNAKREVVDMAVQLKRIKDADMTPFRKTALSLLCQVPPGRYSTYGAMADHISKTSHKTCARAVGSAMRNNPFAPEVPCHRILAADGTLGGFKGSWGEAGTYAKDKHDLLHQEGVRFASNGKVKGPPFRDFS